MRLIRFYLQGKGAKLGILGDDNNVVDFTQLSKGDFNSVQDLIKESSKSSLSIKQIIDDRLSKNPPKEYLNYDDLFSAHPGGEGPHLLLPIVPPEVWAAGVTYKRSVEARVHESQVKDVYDRVYDAVRPEIFMKSTAARVAGPGEKIGIRSDSEWMVPEPELGVVLGENLNIIGYIIGNDVSSRDIEGENPLYLPQAKIFKNSCSLGPVLALAEAVTDPYNLNIKCDIYRDGSLVFSDSANTNQLKRKLDELVAYLGRDNTVFPGTVLLTGTCIVPPDSFSLKTGDVVKISIDFLGELSNQVS